MYPQGQHHPGYVPPQPPQYDQPPGPVYQDAPPVYEDAHHLPQPQGNIELQQYGQPMPNSNSGYVSSPYSPYSHPANFQPTVHPAIPIVATPVVNVQPVTTLNSPPNNTKGYICRSCNKQTPVQNARRYPSIWAWLCCVIMVFVFWPCACLPFCIPACYKVSRGRCAHCNARLDP
ncbi:hypothetical protein AAMO2058_001122700 [Amorphochlora amoebiformis]